MNRDLASVEERLARVVRRLETNTPVAKRDRGLQQLFEQATSAEPGTADTALVSNSRFTVKPDAGSRSDHETDRA